MERQQQFLAAAVGRPPAFDALRQRLDMRRVVVIVVDQAQLRRPAQCLERVGDGVDDGTGGGRRVLRIQRQHQQPAHALALQLFDGARHRRLAVAHRQCHPQRAGQLPIELGLQCRGQRLAEVAQRRTAFVPDPRIGVRGTFRPHAQDHPVQDRPPPPARVVDHPSVAQEFGQIGAHGGGGRGGRRAQVDQQDASLNGGRRALVGMAGNAGIVIGQGHRDSRGASRSYSPNRSLPQARRMPPPVNDLKPMEPPPCP